ncbi:MAG: hypothetical protein M1823_001293 [Watsoniomyces obsoletus]|nr:MAG: hypothetical protein M1823_001293 [Watsoniomyces obsoletus]
MGNCSTSRKVEGRAKRKHITRIARTDTARIADRWRQSLVKRLLLASSSDRMNYTARREDTVKYGESIPRKLKHSNSFIHRPVLPSRHMWNSALFPGDPDLAAIPKWPDVWTYRKVIQAGTFLVPDDICTVPIPPPVLAGGEGQGKRAARSSFQQSEEDAELVIVEVPLLMSLLLGLVIVVLLSEVVELACVIVELLVTVCTDETVAIEVLVEVEAVGDDVLRLPSVLVMPKLLKINGFSGNAVTVTVAVDVEMIVVSSVSEVGVDIEREMGPSRDRLLGTITGVDA